jgi:hypothetical protein
VTECILAIALPKRTTFFHSKANKETKRVTTKDRGKAVALTPNPVFVISQHNNTGLSTKREQIFILFDGEDTHCRDHARSALLAQGAIFPKGDLPERAHTFNALFFLKVTLHPNFTIRM